MRSQIETTHPRYSTVDPISSIFSLSSLPQSQHLGLQNKSLHFLLYLQEMQKSLVHLFTKHLLSTYYGPAWCWGLSSDQDAVLAHTKSFFQWWRGTSHRGQCRLLKIVMNATRTMQRSNGAEASLEYPTRWTPGHIFTGLSQKSLLAGWVNGWGSWGRVPGE